MNYQLLQKSKSIDIIQETWSLLNRKVTVNLHLDIGRLIDFGSKIVGDQNSVYKKQHRDFNIISFSPNSRGTILKEFPKMSMENKIIDNKAKLYHHQSWFSFFTILVFVAIILWLLSFLNGTLLDNTYQSILVVAFLI